MKGNSLRNSYIFDNREQAGRVIAELYAGARDNLVVLAISRGGIPVGYSIASKLGSLLDVATARKLPIPSNPEVGFGAIAPDGSVVLNEELLPKLGILDEEIYSIEQTVLREVHRQEELYRAERDPTEIRGKNVIVTDDGLATGYTMIATIEMTRKKEAASITVAVPVSPGDTARLIEPMVDRLIVVKLSWSYPFAVANFYRDFHNLSDEEVIDYLKRFDEESNRNE
ncbi:MAG: phosphoribosyltransferase family protein [Actinomycetota bacterium]|nr:phosphoribosyltransferase family protein [Actinomycetota bacterium]